MLMVCGAGWAAPPLPWSASAEVEGATGYDTNLFLQIAASPDSPNYHAYRGAFMRVHPLLAGARIGNGYRFELRYGADLIQTFGAGRLYLQDADLSLVIPEIGPFGLRLAATGGRFDAGQFTTDSFWSWGGRGQLTVRARETLRAAATYEIDHRQFVDATALQIRGDSASRRALCSIHECQSAHPVRELQNKAADHCRSSQKTDEREHEKEGSNEQDQRFVPWLKVPCLPGIACTIETPRARQNPPTPASTTSSSRVPSSGRRFSVMLAMAGTTSTAPPTEKPVLDPLWRAG